MAGGRFDKLVGKTLPGTYINFESGRETAVVAAGTRGTVVIPLPKADYGPAKQFIRLTNASPDAAAATLGHSIYDSDNNRQMLLLREAFKRATTVYAYILKEGNKATAEIPMTLAEPETSDINDELLGIMQSKVGVKDEMTGCTISYSRRKRTATVTLTGAVSGVKNTGMVDALAAIAAAGYTIKLDGVTLDGSDTQKAAAALKASPFFTKVSSLEQGGADISATVTVSKDGKEESYTVVVSYPQARAAAGQGPLIDTSEDTNTLTATAKHGGSRGNALTVTVDENPLGGWDVLVHLDGSKVTEYEGLSTIEELIALDNPYITFTGSGELGAAAGVNLTGGTDEEVSNKDITDFIDAWESVKFDTVAFPFDGPESQNVKQAALTKIKYMREDMGRGVQVVIPNAGKMDYEGVINVTNSVSLDGDDLTVAEACAWVAGATAGASNTESLTYVPYAGATSVVNPKSNEEAVAAVNNGEFFFTLNEDDEVVVMYDINTLITFADKKDKSYRKNRVIRVYDTFQQSVQANFPPNKFDNNERGWDIMEGIGKTILRQFEDAGAIRNVSYDEDFLVDREASVDDETYINVGLQAVDSAEKLYFTIKTR